VEICTQEDKQIKLIENKIDVKTYKLENDVSLVKEERLHVSPNQ